MSAGGSSTRRSRDEARLDGGGAPDRGSRAAPRRLGDDDPRHGPPARLPADRSRSRRLLRRSSSSSGAASARTTSPSSTGCSGTSRKLFEWNAFIWPIESLPLVRARMRRRRRANATSTSGGAHEFLRHERALQALRPRASSSGTGRCSRGISRTTPCTGRTSRTAGGAAASVTLMLEILHAYGIVADRRSAGTGSGCGIWPSAGTRRSRQISVREAERLRAEQRFRALGVRLTEGGWEAHPDATDAPVPDRVTFLSPFDRLDPRSRPRGGALRLPLPPRDVRAEGEARVRLLRPADPRRRPTRGPHRAAVRPQDGNARGARRLGRHVARGRGARQPRAPSSARGAPQDLGRDAVRDARDPRRPGARPRVGRHHDADLPDLDLRAGGGRCPQGLRLRACRQPDANRAPGVPRVARRSRARAGVLVRARRRDDAHAPALARRPRRRRQRRLRRHLPHVHPGLRAEGLPLHVPHRGRDLVRTGRASGGADEARLARDADQPSAQHRRHRGGIGGRARGRRAGRRRQHVRDAVPPAAARRSEPTPSSTRRRSTSAATPT